MKKIYLVSISGGKDSQAAWLYMRDRYPDRLMQAYTCDTGWEHETTYRHLDYLAKKLSNIEVISSDKYDGFEDMCVKKKGFPTRIGRFCTVELKIKPAEAYIKSWKNKGYKVVNIAGVRADESKSKKLNTPKIVNGVKWKIQSRRDIEGLWKTQFMGDLPKFVKYKNKIRPPSKKSLKKYYDKNNTVIVYQPIVYWNAHQVLDYNEDQGTINNPLYLKGFSRVGCMPCIMARVDEIGRLTPRHVDRIRTLEENVAKVSSKPIGNKPKFFQDKSKDGDLKGIDHHFNRCNKNALGLDLGCISPYGRCE